MRPIVTSALLLALAAPCPAAPATTAEPDPEGFIRDWLLLGPVFYDPLWPAGAEEIDRQQLRGEATARPHAGERAKLGEGDLTWKAAQATEYGLDLAAALGLAKPKSFVLGYAVAYVVADAPVPRARLRLGTNDYGKVYFNGKTVLRHDVVRALGKDQNGAVVDLKKGVNVLVAKVINDESRWQVAARFVDDAGKPLPVKVVGAPDGQGPAAALDGEGFVRNWLVLGPIAYAPRPYARGQLARRFIADEATMTPRADFSQWVSGHPMRWKPYRAGQPHIDFFEFLHKAREAVPPNRWEANDTLFNVMGYAVTYVHAPEERRDVTVKMGVNDQGKVYVNGKEVVAWDRPGSLKKDVASGRVTLRKGINTVVFKIINAGDNWQGCLRFVDRTGRPMTDLGVSLTPPPTGEEMALR